jgi:hypothetical protein
MVIKMNHKHPFRVAFPLKKTCIDSDHENNVLYRHISNTHIWPALFPIGEERFFETKCCPVVGEIEISENEWVKAYNLREKYLLYVVINCTSSQPRLMRMQDPWSKLLTKTRGFILNHEEITILSDPDEGRDLPSRIHDD